MSPGFDCPSFQNAADGTVCDDGDDCTFGDACRAGVCRPATTVDCVAPDACHEATCSSPGQCHMKRILPASQCKPPKGGGNPKK